MGSSQATQQQVIGVPCWLDVTLLHLFVDSDDVIQMLWFLAKREQYAVVGPIVDFYALLLNHLKQGQQCFIMSSVRIDPNCGTADLWCRFDTLSLHFLHDSCAHINYFCLMFSFEAQISDDRCKHCRIQFNTSFHHFLDVFSSLSQVVAIETYVDDGLVGMNSDWNIRCVFQLIKIQSGFLQSGMHSTSGNDQ